MRLTLLQTLSCCIYVGLKVSATAPEAIGHYRIVSLIGEGGMGEVYLADDSRLGRRVAIKMLSETVSRDPDAKRRMLREARAVAALDHPNVCTIHEVGEHEGRPFIVMQYIEGETLFERMQRTRLSLPESLEIALQVAAALDEAHSHGVVHRDIKTLNIMLTPRGQVKVLDFGLARLEAGSESSTDVLVTKPGTVTGTAPYMSPEQLRGVPIDGRSDIFSFGVVLYEMAMGKRPFDRENAISTITAILFEEPPPVDEDFALLAPILRRALAKEPSKRYATAALLLEDLKKATQPSRTRARRVKTSEMEPTQIVQAAPPRKSRIDSLAVLAFGTNETESELDYLVYGLADSVITALSQMRKLRVIAPTSIDRYSEDEIDPGRVGRELNVAAIAVLRASVDSEHLHVDVELITTSDAAQVWESQYERPVSEVAALAESLAGDIADQIRVRGTYSGPRRVVKKKRAADPEAQQLFLKGRFQWVKRHPEALKLALSYFQQAVEHDPSFAQAYAALADSFLMLGTMQALPPREILPKAKAAAQRAIELDDTLAEPHASIGCAAGLIEWDWDTAERELEEAMRLNPNYPWAPHWLGLLYSGSGRTRRGLELSELAQSLDPLSPIIAIGTGIAMHISRRYDEALARYRHIIESETSFTAGHYYLGLTLEQRGEYAEAISHLEQLVASAGPVSLYMAALSHCYASAGRMQDAEKVLDQLRQIGKQRYVTPFAFLICWIGLGKLEEAMQSLEAALEERNALLWFLPVEPRLDPLRNHPRFAPLVERYGLSPYLQADA